MKTIRHNKLVRDRIPEIIRSAGKEPITDLLSKEDLQDALDAKLGEEVKEYLESHAVEEIADILEVLHGIAAHQGLDWQEIEAERIRKRESRGGFEKGIQLIEVREEEG